MQQNRELLSQIKNSKKPSFLETDILRAHKGITKLFKFKARNENAIDIESTINSMCDTLYNSIRNNRNNTTQRISIEITEHFSKPKEVINDKDLVDPTTGAIYRKGTISIPTNEKVYDDKYHQSDIFSLYTRSSIRNLLDNLTISLIQNRENDMATSIRKLLNNLTISLIQIRENNMARFEAQVIIYLNLLIISMLNFKK